MESTRGRREIVQATSRKGKDRTRYGQLKRLGRERERRWPQEAQFDPSHASLHLCLKQPHRACFYATGSGQCAGEAIKLELQLFSAVLHCFVPNAPAGRPPDGRSRSESLVLY